MQAAPPWLVATSSPLASVALRAIADRVAVIDLGDGTAVTVGVFSPALGSLAAVAELLAAALPYPAARVRTALDRGASLYALDAAARAVPVDEILVACDVTAGAD